MASILLFNKPFRVLSQFTDKEGRTTLADFIRQPGVYPAGRLDYDSEGLLLLCDDGQLQQQISSPSAKLWKTYLVQVDGEPDEHALQRLRDGVDLRDGRTRPARVSLVSTPELWERNPPIRRREGQPTAWLKIMIREGRNRQLRRMLASVGHPVLRLVRSAIGDWTLGDLGPGQYRETRVHLPRDRRRPPRRK